MKYSIYRHLLPILCLLTTVTCHALVGAKPIFQMTGACRIDRTWMVSILNTDSNQRLWLRSGQKFGALQFDSFDPATNTATLHYGSETFETFTLQLHRASDHPQAVASSGPSDHMQRAEIQRKVSEYQAGLKHLLNDPANGPRNPTAQAKLEQDLANMVTNYRDSLLAELEPVVLSELSPTDNKPSVAGVKRRNRVNSRIWASDHIEKHGLPTE